MFKVQVNQKTVGKVESEEDAFASCLELLKQHVGGRWGLLQKYTRILSEQHLVFVKEDGTFISFAEAD